MTVLYPISYGTRMGTIDEVRDFLQRGPVEPEFLERSLAYFVSRGGDLGPGGAFRTVQPNKPGFAEDGKSFHQAQRFIDGRLFYMAIDMVHVNPGGVHRAPRWSEVPRQGSGHPDIAIYGVHANVDGEPWHLQCVEVDGWLSWVNLGRLYPNPNFVLPGQQPPVPHPEEPGQPTEPVPVPVPPGSFTVPTLTSLREGAPNNAAHVQVAQAMLNRWVGYGGYAGGVITEDGNFGPVTKLAITMFQNAMGITADGVVGPQTWGALYSDC